MATKLCFSMGLQILKDNYSIISTLANKLTLCKMVGRVRLTFGIVIFKGVSMKP